MSLFSFKAHPNRRYRILGHQRPVQGSHPAVVSTVRPRPTCSRWVLVLGFLLSIVATSPAAAGDVVVLTDTAIKPVSLGKNTGWIRELISRRQWKKAVKLVTKGNAGARVVKGYLLQKSGHPRDSLAALEGTEKKLPALAEFIHLLRARALLTIGHFPEAAAAAQKIPKESEMGAEAQRIVARGLREAGEYEKSRVAYEAILAKSAPKEIPVALLGLARLHDESGQPERSIGLLKRIDVEYPTHWTQKHAAALAEGIGRRNPKLRRSFARRSLEEQIVRGEKFLKTHRNVSATKALDPLTSAAMTPDQKCRQRYALGRALRKQRKWTRARPLLEEAVKVCRTAKSPLAPWAIHLAGKAAERLSFEDESAAHNRAQLAQFPTHRLADDAAYFLARHLIDDAKDFPAAKAHVEATVAKYPKGDMVPETVFYVAVQAILAKKYATARAILALDEKLEYDDLKHQHMGRTLYWLGRLDLAEKKYAQARKRFLQVIARYPLSWYSIMAYSRLREMNRNKARVLARKALTFDGRADVPGAQTTEWRMEVPADLLGARWHRARLLARLGLSRESQAALAGLEEDPNGLWLSAWILDRAGAYPLSHNIMRRKLKIFRRHPPSGGMTKHWKIAYPRPFGRMVKKASKAVRVNPFFTWGVIREESSFNVGIESFANAIGLMQLILPTARQMATKKEGRVTRRRLKDPAYNITLGTRYLREVRDRTGANWALVPAGYNAGAGALSRWIKARGHLPLDLFVETIPYEEARGYTKRVVASWATYRTLYGGEFADPLPYFSQKVRVTKPKKKRKKKRRRGRRRP